MAAAPAPLLPFAALLAFLLTASAAAPPLPPPANLQLAFLPAPVLGVDTLRPTFSWSLFDAAPPTRAAPHRGAAVLADSVRGRAEMAEMAEMAAAATVPRLAPEDFQSGFRVVVAEDNSVSGELTVTGRQGAR